MDEKEIAELAAKVATEAVDKLSKADRKLTPGDKVVVGDSPEEKLLEDKKGGFKSLGHFAYDVVKADTNQGLSEPLRTWQDAIKKTAGYMEEGDLAQGGYLVPEEFGGVISARALEESIVLPRADITPMRSNRITFAADVDDDHSTDYFGGITIYRPGEGGTKTPTNPTYKRLALTLHKVTGLCYVSDELLEDSVVAIEAELTRKFSQAIRFVQDDDFLNGTGVNMPLGVLNSGNPALVTVTAISGQGANTIIAENIRDIWTQMYAEGKNKCIWIGNTEIFPQLWGMNLAVGTGGIPLWLPAGGLTGSPYQSLMGRPLIYTEKCQALGTAGDLALLDLSQYKVGQRAGIQVAQSMHVRFVTDEQAFRFVLRYDGTPTWTTALTPLRGSLTYSPFVVLHSTRT